MSAPLREPKTLPEWIELDYYRRPRRLRRVRRWLNWSCFLSAGALIAFTFWPGKATVYQSAPVSTAHSMFNNDCDKCHLEPFQTARRFLPMQVNVHSVSDQTCSQCHYAADHSAQQVSPSACASCHQEHRGRPQLSQVADRFCTACHADLHRKDGGPTLENVGDFASLHPEFALWRKNQGDPGQMRFNHQIHLREVGVLGLDRKLTHLQCTACHQLDAERRYMKPISYDEHCASCHPLSVQVVGTGPTAETQQAALAFAREPVPHPRKGPQEARAALRDRLTDLIHRHPDLLQPPAKPMLDRSLPGQRLDDTAPAVDESAWLQKQLAYNQHMLFDTTAGCAYCHIRHVPEGRSAMAGDLPDYLPTQIPSRWLLKSRFNHHSHQMMDCAECHPASGSARTSDVLLPRIDTCHQCHNTRAGQARSDCVECHDYHHPESTARSR